LADVYDARSLIRPCGGAGRSQSSQEAGGCARLRGLVDQQEECIPGSGCVRSGKRPLPRALVALAEQTVTIVAEMLNEIVARAVTAVSRDDDVVGSLATRRRGIRSQRRLVELIDEGNGTAAEEHWRSHMAVVGRVMLGQDATTVIDLMDHQS
jgi:DNA-binding GntR family transcriptional regulator